MVYAEAYGHTAVVAEFEKGNEACTDFFYFGGVFAVGVGQGTERTSGVNEVAWIDAYFLDFLGGGEGGAKNIGKAMGITIATLLITCAISALISITTTTIFGLNANQLLGNAKDPGRTGTTLTETIASIFASTNIWAAMSANSVLPLIF